MKLSTLVAYLNQLEEAMPLQGQVAVHKALTPVLHMVKSNEVQFDEHTANVESKFSAVQQCITQFDQSVLDLKDHLKREIENQETQYFARSYQLYDEEMRWDTADLILNRRFGLSPEAHEKVMARIRVYSEWQHSGMVIRPGLETWIDELVGLDPLYLVDESWEMLEPVRSRFNDMYRNRLCCYTIKEREEVPTLHRIPNGQFSFCLAYNFFNYKPLEVIKRYLTEIYEKLKPGGVVAFTFNNCDRAAGVELAERNFMCFTPKTMIVSLGESLGYETFKSIPIDAANHWLELRKPGELHSIRGGQSLAKVFDKNPQPSIDTEVKKVYTEEQRQQLIIDAVNFGICNADEAQHHEPEALESLVNIKKSLIFAPGITH